MKWASILVLGGLLACCLCAHGCLFQRQWPDLEEFQVNTFGEGPQMHPSAAALVDGRWVVVWQSGDIFSGNGTQDGSGTGVYGQLLGPSGEFEGQEFGIPEETTGDQLRPKVAALSSGRFAVVWGSTPVDDYVGSSDTQSSRVSARVFDKSGLPVSGEIDVVARFGISESGSCYNTDVAALGGGSFVVTWGGRGDGAAQILAVKFEPDDKHDDGYRSLTRVFSVCDSSDLGPDVAPLPGGGFALAWNEVPECWGGGQEEVFVRPFGSDCAPLTSPIPVKGGSFALSYPDRPTLVALSDGTLYVVWDGWLDSVNAGTLARHIGSDGQPLGGVFLLGDGNDWNSLSTPTGVSARPDGGFVLAGSTLDSIRILPMSGAGTPEGKEVIVNTWFGGQQDEAAVAVAPGGEYLVVWQSGRSDLDNAGAEQMGPDGSDFAIFARTLEQLPQ